ncbi:UDP-glycosyltransferase family 35 member A1 [Carabus blaptoides fortunei]
MGLLERNHNITFFSPSHEIKVANFTPIVIEGLYNNIANNFNYVQTIKLNILNSINIFHKWYNWICTKTLKSEALYTLLAEAENGVKYDLIIMDITGGQCLYPLIEIFGSPPVIGTSALGLMHSFTFAFGIDANIAYNPLMFLPYTDHMSLWERTLNYVYTIIFNYWRQWIYLPAEQKCAERVFGKDIRPLDEIEKTFSLLLTNTDPVFDYPQPVPPAIIQVGGLQIFKKTNTLSNDLKQYIDNSEHGVIYFSFGTNIRTDHLGEKIISAFREAFSQLKENILWKFDSKSEYVSSNVLIKPWFPQNEILAHNLVSSIHELIHNSIYKQNIQTISKRYRDKPENALERAIFWTEYVIRHGETNYLHTAAKHMPFYKTWLLDIWGIIVLAVLLIKYTVTQMCRRNKQKPKIKKN